MSSQVIDLSAYKLSSKFVGAIKIGDCMVIDDCLLKVIAVGGMMGSGPRPTRHWIATEDGVVREYEHGEMPVATPKEPAA